MKKILLGLSLVGVSLFGQTYSFESSEGFSEGNVHGQNSDWISTPVGGGGNLEGQLVSTEQASDGTQSVKIVKEDGFPQQANPIVGVFYVPSPMIPVSEFRMSFDVFFNSIGPDTYAFNPANLGAGKYVAVVHVDAAGSLKILKGGDALEDTGFTFEAQKWYNVKYLLTATTVDIYVDGQKVGEANILDNGNVDQVRFVHDNAGGSAYIDNVKFGNDVMSVENVATLKELRVYPNPVKDFLNIEVASSEKIKSVSIFSIDGRTTNLTLESNKIDFSKLPAGAYVLQVETNSQTYTKKVIKK